MKPESYWRNIQTDIRRYRKTEISRDHMASTYPELHIEQQTKSVDMVYIQGTSINYHKVEISINSTKLIL